MVNFEFLKILIKKEFAQISKDKSVLVIAFLMPLMLVTIYGFAMRMDVKPIKVGVVASLNSPIERDILVGLIGSKYLKVKTFANLDDARQKFRTHEINSIIYLAPEFSDDFAAAIAGESRSKTGVRGASGAEILLIQNGGQSQLASLSYSYISGVISQVLSENYSHLSSNLSADSAPISIVSRSWFNEANESSWYLVSGQYAGIVTMVCLFMVAVVVSREWDRGTMASLYNSNASALDIVLSKILAYYLLTLWGAAMTLIYGQILLQIPIRGSVFMLFLTVAVFVLEMTCLGMLVSAVCKNQFLAQQYAIVVGFLPVTLLSGMIFDLRGLPMVFYIIGHILPPTYAVQSLRICFLSGGETAILWQNLAILLAWTLLFFTLCVISVKKGARGGVK